MISNHTQLSKIAASFSQFVYITARRTTNESIAIGQSSIIREAKPVWQRVFVQLEERKSVLINALCWRIFNSAETAIDIVWVNVLSGVKKYEKASWGKIVYCCMFTADKGWPNEIELEIVTKLTHRVIAFWEFVASTAKYNIGELKGVSVRGAPENIDKPAPVTMSLVARCIDQWKWL